MQLPALLKKIKITDIGHVVGGLLINFFPPYIAIIITVLFILYQFDQDWYLKDRAYIDLGEFMIGVFVGAIAHMFM